MKKLLLIIISLMTGILFAQNANYTKAIDEFQSNYNSENYKLIFDSFSPEMKEALPLESGLQFFSGLKAQMGSIENKEFVGFTEETYAVYKTKFENMILAVNLSLDNDNLINGLFIKPYEEPVTAENGLINALDNYPKTIADIIFSKTKDFPDNTQLSIAVIENGKANYYGVMKTNDTLKPIDNRDKIFEIGSVTKVLTSSVLASLVEQGKVKMEGDINVYYPFSFKDGAKINFKDLANHTSGLPALPENLVLSNVSNPYGFYGKDQIEEYLRDHLTLTNEAEKTYAYSNLEAGLLGYTLGLSQKKNFTELLQKEIFDKYEMNNSYVSSENLENKLVKGQNPNGNETSNWDFDVLFGAGGVLSTAEDLVKFAMAEFNPDNKELALTRTPTFNINENMKIGLGWHLLKSSTGKNLVWHNGGTGGYTSSVTLNIADKNAVIILSNLSAYHAKMGNIDELGFELMNEINSYQ